MKIADKDTFKRLQMAGRLGNYFRMWNTVQEVRDSGYTGWLTVRARRASDRALFIPTVPFSCLYQCGANEEFLCVAYEGYGDYCAPLSDVYLQECPAPDTGRIVNLEAMHSDKGLYVRYAANCTLNLRHSLEQNGKDVENVSANIVLQHYLQEDFDQLLDIWDRHPDAVIEASRFTRRVGVFDSRLIIWEVREF